MTVWFRFSIILIFLLITQSIFSQDYTVIFGIVSDKLNKPVDFVNVSLLNTPIGTSTDKSGHYELKIPGNDTVTLVFSSVGFKPVHRKIIPGQDKRVEINQKLDIHIRYLDEIDIEDQRDKSPSLQRLDPKHANILTGFSGNVEAIIKTLPGVSSNNELSSQYSVRGGNFDENLVYVNDIEIYRPFLVRSGQQEGLSFINSDMVSSILFSAGGFDAKYGDKMSSVLDIQYKKPRAYESTVTLSLLGTSVHFEGISPDRRFTHISGFRYQTSQYVLKSLDVKGDYKPSFLDFQTYMTYDITDKFEIDVLGNLAQNKYLFVPENRETTFGTINEALKLKIYFDGREADKYLTYSGAVSAIYRPREKLNLKFIASTYQTDEKETFDIMGQYFLNELDKQLGSSKMGDSLMNIGVGTFLNHARNYLNIKVYNINHLGTLFKPKDKVQWGLAGQHEIFRNKINEWEMLDSAGYSVPYTDSIISLALVDSAEIFLKTNRLTSFIQNTHTFQFDSSDIHLTIGLRGNYWDHNNQLVMSPRIAFDLQPGRIKSLLFRFASGLYYQPPFYKEIRELSGKVNEKIKAQQSIHFVFGVDYQFKAWNRPFKLVTEIYYKHLNYLIPYHVDNVRIRYLGKNMAHGYATGIDTKVFGEFVPGIDSWASLSVMESKENIDDDEHGYIPRPSDQLVNFGMFFQDYLPKFPTYKVTLSLLFGTGLPFGPPNSERWEAYHRMPAYRRVDIGFSKIFISEDQKLSEKNPFRFFKSLVLTAEVFNLLDINNTISYLWIEDIRGRQYAVPNYLTSRRINLKLMAKF